MGKNTFISDLQEGQKISAVFLVKTKDLRKKKNGGDFLMMSLSDKTGNITSMMWENFESAVDTFQQNDFVEVRGVTYIYNNSLQLQVHRIRKVPEDQVDIRDFLTGGEEDVDTLFLEMMDTVDGISNKFLKELLGEIFSDSRIVEKFKKAPAAKMIHHAYLGGLLKHTVSLIRLCKDVAKRYPHLNRDLLLAGAMLHDIGKIDELTYDRAFDYADEGRLLGHIVITCRIVERFIGKIHGFPPDLKNILLHLLVSHHGSYEFGSPKRPKCSEAFVLYYLDDLDSKIESLRDFISKDTVLEGNWTNFNKNLGRYLYRNTRFDEEE
jgi:3'-5' exoribonuclease